MPPLDWLWTWLTMFEIMLWALPGITASDCRSRKSNTDCNCKTPRRAIRKIMNGNSEKKIWYATAAA